MFRDAQITLTCNPKTGAFVARVRFSSDEGVEAHRRWHDQITARVLDMIGEAFGEKGEPAPVTLIFEDSESQVELQNERAVGECHVETTSLPPSDKS